MSEIWFLILVAALLTYVTRFAGYLVLTRFGTVPPRLEAALNAVPTAMLITIVTPVFVDGGWPERAVIVFCGFVALRFSLLPTVVAGSLAIVALRAAGF